MGVLRVPVKVEENTDGSMGYHGWASIRKGEVVTLVPGVLSGGVKDPWQLVVYNGSKYWVQTTNLMELPQPPEEVK